MIRLLAEFTVQSLRVSECNILTEKWNCHFPNIPSFRWLISLLTVLIISSVSGIEWSLVFPILEHRMNIRYYYLIFFFIILYTNLFIFSFSLFMCFYKFFSVGSVLSRDSFSLCWIKNCLRGESSHVSHYIFTSTFHQIIMFLLMQGELNSLIIWFLLFLIIFSEGVDDPIDDHGSLLQIFEQIISIIRCDYEKTYRLLIAHFDENAPIYQNGNDNVSTLIS